jgi:hypothetical protein
MCAKEDRPCFSVPVGAVETSEGCVSIVSLLYRQSEAITGSNLHFLLFYSFLLEVETVEKVQTNRQTGVQGALLSLPPLSSPSLL